MGMGTVGIPSFPAETNSDGIFLCVDTKRRIFMHSAPGLSTVTWQKVSKL